MWNASASHGELFYYGATFVDRIGTSDKTLVMVRPANGQNYDSFIFGQYFSTTIDGNNAATQETLNVIAMIAALDKSITLEDEKAVVAAREAFNLLNEIQQALVTNLETLRGAETTIAYLKQGSNPPAPEPDPDDNNHSGKNYGFIIGAAVAVLGCAAFVIVFVLNTKKKATASAAGEETVTEAKDDENTADENEADNGEKKD